ncbi:MAG: MBL fold metallo-hydrolase [Alphaproteobacteria bacterium]|nr:MBL fold metallo-hydrolase [Alphaproteobacteria bacterium]
MNFDRSLDAPTGVGVRLSPLVSRILAPNPGPFTFKGTGTYLIGAGADVAVVDPGPLILSHVQALQRAVGRRRLSHILITHTHRDHAPASAPLKEWSGARTYALAPAAQAGAGEGAADEAHDHDFVPDELLVDGAALAGDGFDIACLATPGHTANHMCFVLAQEKALFSGDHVMGWSTSVIAPPDGEMGEYVASLEKLSTRDDAIFYPTHGSPIPQPNLWLQQLIAHRRQREVQILDALVGGAAIPAIVEKLYPAIDTALRGAAALQTLAHLDWLKARGLVIESSGRWIRSGIE